MAKDLDVILVVDVESTCWETNPPHGQTSDIIEIGLCPVDVKSLTRLEKRSILVKPARSAVSDFCTQLTTLTDEMLADASSFAEATDLLRKQYNSRNRLWASWGDYDRRQFERNCEDLGIAYPFGQGHLNLKTLFAVAHGHSREYGMAGALELLDMPLEGTHHRGHDDAWNIAAVLCELLKKMR